MPKSLRRGTAGFFFSAWAVEAATRVSRPRRSQRKLSQESAAPIARPAPHKRSRSAATRIAAIKPTRSVSQEMRRSVTAAGEESSALDAIAASSEPPENVAHASIETNATEHEKEKRLGMKPAVEKIAEEAADNHG